MREYGAGEFVDHQLRGLEVHVPIDEAGQQHLASGVDGLAALIVAPDGGYVPAGDGHVGLEELAGEDRKDAAPFDDQVGGLVPPGHGQPASHVLQEAGPLHRHTLPCCAGFSNPESRTKPEWRRPDGMLWLQ